MSTTREQTFINGKIFTARNEKEFVSAFKIFDGKISWAGDASEVDATGAIDLKGKTVLPGFIDIHTHPNYVAMTVNSIPCTVPVVNNIPEMIEALKKHQNYGKGSNDWVEGFALTIAWALSAIILLSSDLLFRLLKHRGLTAMERLTRMLLVMLAVQMFMNGVAKFLKS